MIIHACGNQAFLEAKIVLVEIANQEGTRTMGTAKEILNQLESSPPELL
jgi:hypothetical protein